MKGFTTKLLNISDEKCSEIFNFNNITSKVKSKKISFIQNKVSPRHQSLSKTVVKLNQNKITGTREAVNCIPTA